MHHTRPTRAFRQDSAGGTAVLDRPRPAPPPPAQMQAAVGTTPVQSTGQAVAAPPAPKTSVSQEIANRVIGIIQEEMEYERANSNPVNDPKNLCQSQKVRTVDRVVEYLRYEAVI